LKTKIFYSTLKNALAYAANAGVVAVNSKDVGLAQFFKQKSSRASGQVCRPSAEQADKFMLYFTK
jgi:hypothetical protein